MNEDENVRQLLKEWPRLQIDSDGILRRETATIYIHLHEHMRPLGSDRMVALARYRFSWPKMRQEIEHHITQACQCIKKETLQSDYNTPSEY